MSTMTQGSSENAPFERRGQVFFKNTLARSFSRTNERQDSSVTLCLKQQEMANDCAMSTAVRDVRSVLLTSDLNKSASDHWLYRMWYLIYLRQLIFFLRDWRPAPCLNCSAYQFFLAKVSNVKSAHCAPVVVSQASMLTRGRYARRPARQCLKATSYIVIN